MKKHTKVPKDNTLGTLIHQVMQHPAGKEIVLHGAPVVFPQGLHRNTAADDLGDGLSLYGRSCTLLLSL